MRLIFKEGSDMSLNKAVVTEVNDFQVEDFKVIHYEEGGDEATPVLIVEDESGNETARLTDFEDLGELTDFIWDSF